MKYLVVGEVEHKQALCLLARFPQADRDALIASYAEVVPEALDALSGEDRMRVYELLQLEVECDMEGYEVSGLLCRRRPRGRGRFDRTNQTELRFHALLTENGTPQTKWMRV